MDLKFKRIFTIFLFLSRFQPFVCLFVLLRKAHDHLVWFLFMFWLSMNFLCYWKSKQKLLFHWLSINSIRLRQKWKWKEFYEVRNNNNNKRKEKKKKSKWKLNIFYLNFSCFIWQLFTDSGAAMNRNVYFTIQSFRMVVQFYGEA